MKTRQYIALLTLLIPLASHDTFAAPLGTVVTYQGHLQQSGSPVNGLYDFRFGLWDDPGTGTLIGATQSVSSVTVSNSEFTVALDFGVNAFNGDARWLDIAVRTNNGGAFTTLNPRQQFRPLPYALYAPGAGTSATASSVAAGSINNAALAAGAVTGDKIAGGTIQSSNVNVTSFSDTFWKLDGNAGTTAGTHFLGTTDNQPLELKVYNQRALRLEPNAAGAPNLVGGNGSAVGLGSGAAMIGGGANNQIQFTNNYSTIAGGSANTSEPFAHFSTISGGAGNLIRSNAQFATVAGGYLNRAAGSYSFAAGQRANANHTGSFVWADSTATNFASTANNQFLIRASGGVGINTSDPLTPLHVKATGSAIALEGTGSVFGLNPTPQSKLEFYPWGVAEGLKGWIGYDLYRVGAQTFTSLRIVNEAGKIDLVPGGGERVVVYGDMSVDGTMQAQTVTITSDRGAKQDFVPVDAKEILNRVASMPVQTWAFKSKPDTRHIGPVAQDFYAAFGVGADDKHIATVDADGAALAAIQGLYQMLKEKDDEISELKKRVTAMESSLASEPQADRQSSTGNSHESFSKNRTQNIH